jgi:hypothetical protein
MGAEFFSVAPGPMQPQGPSAPASMEARLRRLHRWTSVIFTLTVAANFTAMIWGQPPPLITYSPLPPLMLLLLTGLYMLARHRLRARGATQSLRSRR